MKLAITADEQISVDLGGGESVTWRIGAELPKPFIHPITLAGQAVTLASPHDHVHHRGAMFAMKVDGVNYWEEGEGPEFGVQRVRAVDAVACSRDRAAFALEIEWLALVEGDPGGPPAGASSHGAAAVAAVQIKEARSFVVERAGRGILITWRSRLVPGPDRCGRLDVVELSGKTPHAAVSYYGLGVRFPRAMDLDGEHLNAAGDRGAETHGRRAAWHDYSGRLDETNSLAGIAMFDHPQNPRHPTEWFSMSRPFAYVSASLVATQEYALLPEEPLELTYGLWAHHGRATMEEIKRIYQRWSASSRD